MNPFDIKYDPTVLGLHPRNRLLWITGVITRKRPVVSALESFAYHGWKTSSDNEIKVVASTRSTGLIFPGSRPHVITDLLGERPAHHFPLDMFPGQRQVGLVVYDHAELMRVFQADSSAMLSGRERPSLTAERFVRDAGLQPRRQGVCSLVELINLTGIAATEYRRVGEGDGGMLSKIALDEDHISAQLPYFCAGLCIPSRADQARLMAAIRPHRAMYYTEMVEYPRAWSVTHRQSGL